MVFITVYSYLSFFYLPVLETYFTCRFSILLVVFCYSSADKVQDFVDSKLILRRFWLVNTFPTGVSTFPPSKLDLGLEKIVHFGLEKLDLCVFVGKEI